MKYKLIVTLLLLPQLSNLLYSENNNLLKNGGFEQQWRSSPANWQIVGSPKTLPNAIIPDTQVVKTGKYSLKAGGVISTYACIYQTVGSGLLSDWEGDYELCGWIKSQGISSKLNSRGQPFIKPFLGIWTYNIQRNNAATINLIKDIELTNEWVKFRKIVTQEDIQRLIKDKSKPVKWNIRINICRQPGYIWVDELSFRKIQKPECEFFLRATEVPANTGYLKLDVKVNHSLESLRNSHLELKIIDHLDKIKLRKKYEILKGNFTISIPIKGLSIGTYGVNITVLNSQQKTFNKNFKIITNELTF